MKIFLSFTDCYFLWLKLIGWPYIRRMSFKTLKRKLSLDAFCSTNCLNDNLESYNATSEWISTNCSPVCSSNIVHILLLTVLLKKGRWVHVCISENMKWKKCDKS